MQSALGVLGQGAYLEERLANNKYGGRLIYTPAPIAACARLRSSMGPFRPAPDVAPVRAQTHVSMAMAEPESPSAAPGPCVRACNPVRARSPRLELVPGPIRLCPFPSVRPEAFEPAPTTAR
jgi:hypothetical protein